MKTKLKIMSVLSALLFTATLTAQDTTLLKQRERIIIRDEIEESHPLLPIEFGLFYLPTFSTMQLRTTNGQVVTGDVSTTHGFGVMFGYNFTKNIGIQADVNYQPIDQKYTDQNISRELKVKYLNVPVLLSLNTDKTRMINLNVIVGPQFGINVGSTAETLISDASARAVSGAKGVDLGVAYGAGLQFMLSSDRDVRLDLGWRGLAAVTDLSSGMNSVSPGTYNVLVSGSRKTNAIYVGLTWLFGQ